MTLASRRKDIQWGFDGKRANNPNFTGGKYVDDKGYIRVLMPEHPHSNRGYVYEHRLVVERELGRYLQPWESIHHINEIKIDNRWENLYLTTVPEHSSIHREGKKKTKKVRKKLRDSAKERMKSNKRNNGKFSPASDVLE